MPLEEGNGKLKAGMSLLWTDQFVDQNATVDISWSGKEELLLDIRGQADDVTMQVTVPVTSSKVANTFRRMRIGPNVPKP